MRGFLLAYKSLCFFLPAILIVHPISLGYLELMENERFCALFTMFDVLSSQSFHLVKESRFVLQMTISSSWLNWVKQHLFRWVWYCSFSQFRLVDTSLIFQPSLLLWAFHTCLSRKWESALIATSSKSFQNAIIQMFTSHMPVGCEWSNCLSLLTSHHNYERERL